MVKNLREPVNGITHLVGAVLSLFALCAMILKLFNSNVATPLAYISVFAFGIGMVLLYGASATYHSIISTDNVIRKFRKLDHSMIFILIMGSYAPFCLIALHNKVGYALFIAVASACVLGIIFNLCWITCPKWLSSTVYIAVGWFAVFAIYPISKVIPFAGIFLLFFGGIIYSIGGVIYALKKVQIKIGPFGNHEIFHLLIMAGTLCHFLAVYLYIL